MHRKGKHRELLSLADYVSCSLWQLEPHSSISDTSPQHSFFTPSRVALVHPHSMQRPLTDRSASTFFFTLDRLIFRREGHPLDDASTEYLR